MDSIDQQPGDDRSLPPDAPHVPPVHDPAADHVGFPEAAAGPGDDRWPLPARAGIALGGGAALWALILFALRRM